MIPRKYDEFLLFGLFGLNLDCDFKAPSVAHLKNHWITAGHLLFFRDHATSPMDSHQLVMLAKKTCQPPPNKCNYCIFSSRSENMLSSAIILYHIETWRLDIWYIHIYNTHICLYKKHIQKQIILCKYTYLWIIACNFCTYLSETSAVCAHGRNRFSQILANIHFNHYTKWIRQSKGILISTDTYDSDD